MTRFTGGDNLTGRAKTYHEVTMQTELNNGEGAYKASFAGGDSGISFGGNQMDLAKCKHKFYDAKKTEYDAVKVFTTIMGDSGLFTEDELKIVKEPTILKQTGKTPKEVFGKLLTKVNQALSSDSGRQLIDEVYENEIKNTVDYVTKTITNHIYYPPIREAILNNDEMMVRLMDYHNQFSLSTRGNMMKYLNGETLLFNCKFAEQDHILTFKLTETPNVDNLVSFIRATHHYNKDESGARGLETRLAKLAKYFGTPLAKHEYGSVELNAALTQLESGERGTCTLFGETTKYTRSLSIRVNKEKMMLLQAEIIYDDYAYLMVNDTIVYSDPKGINDFKVFEENGQRMIKTIAGCVVPAESNRVKNEVIDITNYVDDGVNHITLNVIVEVGGNAFLKLYYTHIPQ